MGIKKEEKHYLEPGPKSSAVGPDQFPPWALFFSPLNFPNSSPFPMLGPAALPHPLTGVVDPRGQPVLLPRKLFPCHRYVGPFGQARPSHSRSRLQRTPENVGSPRSLRLLTRELAFPCLSWCNNLPLAHSPSLLLPLMGSHLPGPSLSPGSSPGPLSSADVFAAVSATTWAPMNK
jgi:hypothetical protein